MKTFKVLSALLSYPDDGLIAAPPASRRCSAPRTCWRRRRAARSTP